MVASTQETILAPAVCEQIDKLLEKYPDERKQSALISALHIVQAANEGWLSRDLMDAVADYLGLPRIVAYEVATFYSMYELDPVGRHKISLCTNISCMLRGSQDIADHLQQRLGVKLGETTADGRFTLREVECLGACVGAPMMQVGQAYHEHLTPEKIDEILDGLE